MLDSNVSEVVDGWLNRTRPSSYPLFGPCGTVISGRSTSAGLQTLRSVIKDYAIPATFSFGIVGNALNLMFLSIRFFRCTSGRTTSGLHEPLERSALAGMIALSMSDMLLCLVGVLSTFLGTSKIWNSLYGPALHNWFLFASTWITVIISAERFVVVLYPVKARWFLKARNGLLIYAIIFLTGLGISSPLFVRYKVVRTVCYHDASVSCSFLEPSGVFAVFWLRTSYHILWVVIYMMIPILVLAVTNVGLIRALYRSRSLAMSNANRYRCGQISMTVSVIVCSFILLVSPSMLLETFQILIGACLVTGYDVIAFRTAFLVANLALAVKFSANFLLYCSIMKQFRSTIKNIARCRKEYIQNLNEFSLQRTS